MLLLTRKWLRYLQKNSVTFRNERAMWRALSDFIAVANQPAARQSALRKHRSLSFIVRHFGVLSQFSPVHRYVFV
jgi:hypothetical protein